MLFSVASGALGVGPTAWSTLDDTHRATLVEAVDAMDGGNGAMPIVQWGPFVAFIGLVAVAVALWRHNQYPRWATVAVPVGWLIFLSAPTHAVRAAGAIALLAGFMPLITRRAGGWREPGCLGMLIRPALMGFTLLPQPRQALSQLSFLTVDAGELGGAEVVDRASGGHVVRSPPGQLGPPRLALASVSVSRRGCAPGGRC